ncbi:RidA family protein [Afipia massiliensis]|uniref:RidA family protein n=1 Tax=Afipia massiliensis TaxID=211460 RepID=A0A4U6BJ56_9BRAD|nr:RidA family protein [Afipia massiliensis]
MALMIQQKGSFEMTNLAPARPRYSPARRIPLGPSGDLLLLSGVICHDDDARDNIEEQTRRIFARVAAVLKDHNAAITDIVKTTSYLTDLADYDGFNRVRVEIFIDCKEPPASTAVGVGSLLGQGTRLEVDVIALVPHIGAAK